MKAEQRILEVLRNYPLDGCGGYDISRLARVRAGELYPILARLETEGVVKSWWASNVHGRRRKYRLAQKHRFEWRAWPTQADVLTAFRRWDGLVSGDHDHLANCSSAHVFQIAFPFSGRSVFSIRCEHAFTAEFRPTHTVGLQVHEGAPPAGEGRRGCGTDQLESPHDRRP